MVARLEGWQKNLSDYLKARQKMPFAWGEHDCMAFVAHGVEALTGEQLFENYAGYSDQAGAKAILLKHGGIDGILTKKLGEGHTRIMTARRGDVVVVELPELTAGIVDDSGQRIALVADKVLRRVPLRKAIKVWGY